jgi:NAD(P)-dependent dehydrogenase (short-subunit alcohol dehydrogenase family)
MEDAGRWAVYPSLKERVVVVTGGASGIGESIVEAFARQGAQVVFLDVQDEAAEGLVRQLEGAGLIRPVYWHCDLTDMEELRRVVGEVLVRFPRVDVLVNNAANDTRHPVEDVSAELWDRTIAVNLKHQFLMTQALLASMRAAGGGSIVNMGSISWVIGGKDMTVYNTAKAGIVGMTRSFARELGAENIRVNCVMPGAVVTERQRRLWFNEEYEARILASQALKRMIQPEEVARLVLFLAADDSAVITNQSYIVDAGWV